MNIQPKRPGKPDAAARLAQLWGLTEQNAALARRYLTEKADDSLLSGAERQVFSSFNWQARQEICETLQEITAPNHTENQARVLKLLWAIGRSTAGFAALFDPQHIRGDVTASDAAFRQYSEVLGPGAAAAMDAEYPAALPNGYVQTRRLHQLAQTDPEALLEAQRLIADPQNSMADGVLAGVLLAAAKPAEEKPGFFGRLLGGAPGQRRVKAGTQPARQVELVLAWVDAILDGAFRSGLTSGDIARLKAYVRAGDPAAPVPAVSVPTAWQLPAEELLSCELGSRLAVECAAPSVLFGIPHDSRMACAMGALAGLDPYGALWGAVCFLPREWDVGILDAMLPHIPGGAATLLRFISKRFGLYHEELAKKLVRRFHAGVDEALRYADMDEYANLCGLLPAEKNSGSSARMEQMRSRVRSAVEKAYSQGAQQAIVRDYLAGRGAFEDSVALLKPIRSEYRYLYNADDILRNYKKLAGWDAFACRCIVLFCLTCAGYNTFSAFSLNGDQKQSIDAFISALAGGGLPVRDCITVLAAMHENWYQEEAKRILGAAVEEHFVTPEGLEALADAALSSSAAARVMAVEGLDALTARPDCAGEARRALLACAGDTSKQVQEILVQCYVRHPEWEKDYLAMLGSRKAAQRSLTVRVLAGIDAQKYRPVLENALAVEKNGKLLDQIAALLGAPAGTVGAGGQTAGDLAAQVLKGGKKRKVQWLLSQPLPVVRRIGENAAPAEEDQIAALFVAYADLGRMGRSDTAAAIAGDLEPRDLETLACEVWALWMKEGAQSKTKWVLPFTAVFGGAAMTSRLIRAINDWPQNARGAIACDAVAALAISPDPAALVAVDSISRKFKFRQVKAAAAAALENAARELGITAEELADRIVPTLDFAADGTRIFDYGTRRFVVRLTPTLELTVTAEGGKTVKALPAPGKTDDREKAPAAYEAYKTLKKQIRATVAAQRARLEAALSAQRCWESGAWRKLFVENPVMHQFAISLIWGVYEDGGLRETFRYMEDGSYNTVDEEEYTLPDHGSIGLVHPIELEEETLAAWKQQLEDYEIIQSIDQLNRPIYRLPQEQAESAALETAAGRRLNALSLMGKLQGMGWYKGSVVDGGGFYTFYREDPSVGIGVELSFSGCFVGGENEEITVYDAVFYKSGTVKRGSYCYDAPKEQDVFRLGQVPPRYYSEVVWQLERATASSTGTDPDWRKNRN